MKLPKIRLSKFSLVLSIILIFSLLSSNIAIHAQSVPAAQQEKNKPTQEGKVSTSSASLTSDEQGKTKGIWIILAVAGAAILLEELLGPGIITEGIDCIKDFGQCVAGANALTQNFVYKQNTGCDFAPPRNGVYPDQCQQEKMTAVAAAFRNDSQTVQTKNGGFLDIASNITNSTTQIPVPITSGQYFASINPFQQAHAQGADEDFASQLSSNGLLLGIWQTVRNASYALLVVILVVIGFMVMIRWKTDPRTSVTLQNSLPRIAVSLLLITFSFAIAGFLADLMRVLSGLAMGLVPGPNFDLVAIILSAIATTTMLGGAALAFMGSTIAAIALLFFSLILIAILLVVFINLIFKIITRYVIFILLTLFAPLFFLLGALPGGSGIIVTWFRRVIAALLAIPAVAFILKLSFLISFAPFITANDANLPVPWLVPNPINSVLAWALLGPVVGIGLFFFATKIPDIIDEIMDSRALGARAGIGPGFIVGAPSSALRTTGGMSKGLQGYIGFGLPGSGWLKNKFPNLGGQGQGPRGCLADTVMIDTPKGPISVTSLKKGGEVWSTDSSGNRLATSILKIVKTTVSSTHKITHLVLNDGRALFISPTHPLADHRVVDDLKPGQDYDGSIVVSNKTLPYHTKYTYDILPAGKTSTYWANGVLVGSTLSVTRSVFKKIFQFA